MTRLHTYEHSIDVPRNEDELVPLSSTALGVILEIVHCPFALSLRKLCFKFGVIALGGCLLDDDLGKVIAEAEDDVLVLLSELEFLEGLEALRVNTDAGGLDIDNAMVSL